MAEPTFNGVSQQVPLSGKLAEFREALLSEIDASDRISRDNAIPLINGRLSGRIGPFIQYNFEIENVLTLPADTPGNLHVPGHGDFEVSIVAIDGLSITIAVQADLGAFVPNATLRSNLTFLMRKLIQRIEAWGSKPNPVGERVLGEGSYNGELSEIDVPGLNREQSSAVGSSLGRDTTYIWGPPGTGKTLTIGAIAAELIRNARSTLLVSHTNTAVDQALIRIARRVDPSLLSEGLVLRVGQPKDQRIKETPDLLLETHRTRISQALEAERQELEQERESLLQSLQQVTCKFELLEWLSEAGADISRMQQEFASQASIELELHHLSERLEELAGRKEYWIEAKKQADKAGQWNVKLDKARKVISKQQDQLSIAIKESTAASNELRIAQQFLDELKSVGWLTRKWRGWPSSEEQQKIVNTKRLGFERVEARRSKLEAFVQHNGKIASAIEGDLGNFRNRFGATPEEVLTSATAYKQEIADFEADVEFKRDELTQRQATLHRELSRRLLTLHEAGMVESSCADGIEVMLSTIWAGYDRAAHSVANEDLKELQCTKRQIEERNAKIQAVTARIDLELREVEDRLISRALVVATTLTRSYLRDSIQERRFDTVIFDEASMAPIPALWVAASLADANAVVVGDWKQLPPIVISKKDAAKKWLGRDVFEVARAQDKSNLVRLREQYRMNATISQIINTLFYDGELRNATSDQDIEQEAWYRQEWAYDCPLLLVDMGPLNAWVTSVPRGKGSSRLNFLSAAICLNITQQLLRPDRTAYKPTSPPRIMIVCPYRPHARLLELMLRQDGLYPEVVPGTIHSFQGSEADVVILDLVNDEPHRQVGMFSPKNDESTKRQLNVAVSRTAKRLIVVGDFDFISEQGGKAFIGQKFVPLLLQSGKRVSAADAALMSTHSRAANAAAEVFGGATEAPLERVVVTQSEFYGFLNSDMAKAEKRIVIFSAFITRSRLEVLGPQLRSAIGRGVRIFVVTKTHQERNRQERNEYLRLENALRKWGISIIHKHRMHEKLVFIDADILWVGSLNPLSFSNTQEIMERRDNRQVVEDYAKTIWLEKLIVEFERGAPTCPCCGNEVVVAVGKDDPFYWRCIKSKDCYSRSADAPRVVDGLVPCHACEKPVEFFMPKTTPYWRCTSNNRHRRKLHRSDLLLPAMRKLIPKKVLRDLDRRYGISEDDEGKLGIQKESQQFLPLDE